MAYSETVVKWCKDNAPQIIKDKSKDDNDLVSRMIALCVAVLPEDFFTKNK